MISPASIYFKIRSRVVAMLRGPFHAAWYTGDDALMHGLVRWQLRVTAVGLANQLLEVNLRLSNSAGALLHTEQIKLDSAGRAEREYAAHTQMLPEGKATLHASWSRPDGGALAEQVFAVQTQNQPGLGQATAQALREAGVPFLGKLPCDSSQYPYATTALRPWFDEANALELLGQRIQNGQIREELRAPFEHFVKQGFMVFEGLLDDETVDGVNADLTAAIERKHAGYEYGSSQRLEDLHRKPCATRSLFLSRKYLDIVDQLYGAPARPCQTLGYVFGSQQDPHQDTIHLTPFPAGYMNGVWFALQDVQPGAGELVVYPGSHRFPRATMQATACAKVASDWTEFGQKVVPHWAGLIAQSGIEAQVYRPKKGTVLFWHENLMHGGSVRADASLERRSMVIHTFAQGAVIYYDSSGKVGNAEAAS